VNEDISNITDNFNMSANLDIDTATFIIGLILSAISAYLIGMIYNKFATTLSNKKDFSKIFVPLCLATVLIITIVKSSIALSLGLVGALSIVRFRAAIKEPEELVYLFIIIAVGLGYGANQFIITFYGSFIIVIILIILSKFAFKEKKLTANDLDFSITINKKLSEQELNKIINIVTRISNKVKLSSTVFIENETSLNFEIQLKEFNDLNILRSKLQNNFKKISISSTERKYLSL
tara:strand:- start:259 stop:963 length:705 start_codon:yes stop_codon:yes gene_type:complete